MAIVTRAAASDAHIGQIADILEGIGIVILCMEEGYVVCPGRDLHTGQNSDRDCRAWVNADTGVPAIFCFHTSWSAVCAELNARLKENARGRHRRYRATTSASPPAPTVTASLGDLTFDSKTAGAAIQTAYGWPSEEIERDPRGKVCDAPDMQWPYLIALFPEDVTIWVGRDLYDSGKPTHRHRFRTAAEWLRSGRQPGAYIGPNRFKPGSFRRSNENVANSDFLVVESDELGRDEIGAVFRWMEQAFADVRLRAVVDTGGKSLHGWFDYPSANTAAALTVSLPRLGCDPAMFRPAQPSRLPGVIRPETGRYQRLIYFVP